MSEIADALSHLNDEQRDAVMHHGNTVVLAGPGSGKTDTLTLKVASLLMTEIKAPRGVACLTYSNDAVRELTNRLRRFGLRPSQRLFLGTVHSFCLTRILRPFAALAGKPELADWAILAGASQRMLVQRALDLHGIPEDPRWFGTTLSRIRKALVCDEDISSFDPRYIAVARSYEDILRSEARLDFDAVTFEALKMLETDAAVSDLIVARYPWFAIDEYQDLGGTLHRMVGALRDAGASVFAVGDPDQSIYGFAGADPRYLTELQSDTAFHSVQLRFNYRAGSRLIDASEAVLEEARGYRAAPDRDDPGEIVFREVGEGLEEQVEDLVDLVLPNLISSGIARHEIAILYRARGQLADLLSDALEAAEIPYVFERDARFPGDPLIRWLQRCAAWSLDPLSPDVDAFTDLVMPFRQLREEAGYSTDDDLEIRKRLFAALDSRVKPEFSLTDFLARVDEQLGVLQLLAQAGSRPDEEATFRELTTNPADGLSVADFANSVQIRDRVLLTTYHGSKGRQFDAVILPGLQETILPMTRWNRATGTYTIASNVLAEERRLFYVGLTRARTQVVFTYSPRFTNAWGYGVDGRSRFVDEVVQRLNDGVA